MSTTDFQMPVAGVRGPTFRNNLADIFEALASTNRSPDEPPVTYAGQLQVLADTSQDILRVRNRDDNGWITIGPLDVPNLGLAPLDGPEFTGNVRVPTKNLSNDSNAAASTAFVKGLLDVTSRHRLSVSLSANQAISNNTFDLCRYDTVDLEDTTGSYDPVTGTYTCQEDGTYVIYFEGSISWTNTSGSASFFFHGIKVNSMYRYSDKHYISDISGVSDASSNCFKIDLVAGDTINGFGYCTNATSADFTAGECFMRIEKEI